MQDRYPGHTGAELVEVRERLGVTQKEVAVELGKAPKTLWEWETGRTRVTTLRYEHYLAAAEAAYLKKRAAS